MNPGEARVRVSATQGGPQAHRTEGRADQAHAEERKIKKSHDRGRNRPLHYPADITRQPEDREDERRDRKSGHQQ